MSDGKNGHSTWDFGSIKLAINILRERYKEPYIKFSYDARIGPEDEELEKEPEAFTTVHNILKDCVTLQSCKHIHVGQLAKLLMDCQNESRDAWIGEWDYAIWSYGYSPTSFYLKWAKKFDQSELLRYWLTEAVRSGQLAEISGLDEIPKHQLVAAQFSVDKHWYRAQILQVRSSEDVRVLFVDYGNTEYCYVHQLRILPQELMELNRMAFKAKLYYMNVDDDNIEGTEVLTFSNKLRNSRRINCQIMGTMKAWEGFEVELFDENGSVLHFFPPSSYITPLDPDPDITVFSFSTTHPLSEEIPLLVHKSEELVLQPRPWTYSDDYDHYSVVTVIDPKEIYVKNLGIPDDDMINRLNEFCDETSEWKHAYRIKTSRLFKNRLYAWHNKEETAWERVRVVRVDLPVGKVYVQRVDYGNKLVVNVADMMELSPRFCKQHPLVETAHLPHIKPPNGHKVWPGKTCDDLKHIFKFDTEFLGVLFSRVACSDVNSTVRWKSLGLLLTPASPKLTYSVQGILVALGLADGTGISAGNPNIIFPDQRCSDYYNGAHNGREYKPSVISGIQPDLGTLKYPYKIRGDDDELVKMGKILLNFEENQSKFLPLRIRSCLGWVKFSQIYGPGHFYLQMENKKDELHHMMTDLEENINYQDITPEEIISGAFVAVFYVHEENNTVWRAWNRSFILRTNSRLRQAEVVLIDFGIETIVSYQYIRKLPLDFLTQIPYCQRVHVDVPEMMPTALKNAFKTWSSTAVRNFGDYIKKWSVECPVYLAYRSNVNRGIVQLNKFDEELVYIPSTGAWTISTEEIRFGRTGPDYTCLNSFRQHELLKHLFNSVGIQIYYEVFKGDKEFYDYEPAWNSLLENGLLIENTFLKLTE